MTTVATSSPVMIGRDDELAALLAAFDEGRAGRPRAVVVRGEAGIGKTRLLDEFHAAATAAPADLPPVVAVGRCVDAIGAPLSPVRRLLRDVLAAVGEDAFREAALTRAAADALATLVPGLGEPAAPPVPGLVTEAIETLVENLSADHHLVLVLEDLHWADTATLALLRTLAATLRGSHLTIVMTFRSDEVDRSHPLRPLVAELERNRSVVHLDLARLAPDQVAEQVAHLVGVDGASVAPGPLAERSGGVPFLVEELVGLAAGELPESLREVLLARYERLSPSARAVVRAAAAGGVHVDHRLLATVAEVPDLDRALREAVDGHVLVGDRDGYTFRHALTQEAVHDELIASERIALHGRYAAALEDRAGAGVRVGAAAVANHWRLADEPARALAATAAAYREARTAGAVVVVPELVDAMAELWPQVPDAEVVVGLPLWALLSESAQALRETADEVRGLRVIEDALVRCPPDERHGRALLLRLRWIISSNAGLPVDGAWLDEAESLLVDSDVPADRVLLALVWSVRAVDFARVPPREGRVLADRAVAEVERWGTAADVASCVGNRAWVLNELGDFDASRVDVERAAQLFPSPLRLCNAGVWTMEWLDRQGRYDEEIATGERAVAQLRAAGYERGWTAICQAYLVRAYFTAGRPSQALALLSRTAALLPRVARDWFLATPRLAYRAWNDEPGPDLIVEPWSRSLTGDDWWAFCVWLRAHLDRLLGAARDTRDPGLRARIVEEALALAAPMGPPGVHGAEYRTLLTLPSLARLVAAARRERLEVPAGIEERLAAVPVPFTGLPIGEVCRALVDAELASVEPADPGAARAWERAVVVLDAVSAPAWFLPYALFRWGEALVAGGDKAAAAAPLARAVAVAPGVGASIVARWARELAARARVALPAGGRGDGPVAAPGTTARPVTGVGALTARELQVLGLVAEGLTNPQIGQRLFISRKTVSVHVSAILAKIGATTRAEAAAVYAAHAAASSGAVGSSGAASWRDPARGRRTAQR